HALPPPADCTAHLVQTGPIVRSSSDTQREVSRMNMRLGLALALSLALVAGLLLMSHSRHALADEEALALSRACRWLAKEQGADGSLAEPSQRTNFDVWETVHALVALLRCGSAVDQAVLNKGFEFLDANWVDTGGLPESQGRRFSPFKSHCVETTSVA